MTYICDLCGGHSEEPHGCACGGTPIPNDPLPVEAIDDGYPYPAAFDGEDEDGYD